MSQRKTSGLLGVAVAAAFAALAANAQAGGTLRIAMTASDVPTTTGAPDNGFEGVRFLGYPVYEGLVIWDLSRADKLAEIRPGLQLDIQPLPRLAVQSSEHTLVVARRTVRRERHLLLVLVPIVITERQCQAFADLVSEIQPAVRVVTIWVILVAEHIH